MPEKLNHYGKLHYYNDSNVLWVLNSPLTCQHIENIKTETLKMPFKQKSCKRIKKKKSSYIRRFKDLMASRNIYAKSEENRIKRFGLVCVTNLQTSTKLSLHFQAVEFKQKPCFVQRALPVLISRYRE
ncbi:hypothetical protein AVEN_84510-1 [Araneus ventricosus]|uniref:Uncharacterized protein n=1 Tax=Araneus ventricosus TaxID=182803 RepID=A0A4Y2D708_ARAVE|nr:hypothetical protein AVEN_84510-1 [Araneus ventricosus]